MWSQELKLARLVLSQLKEVASKFKASPEGKIVTDIDYILSNTSMLSVYQAA